MRQVDEADRGACRQPVAHRHPFGREGREREERAVPRAVGPVDEERHRRRHRLVGGEGDQRIGIRRPLDQQAIGREVGERRPERAGRAGAVVADAEEADVGHRRGSLFDRSCGSSHPRSRSLSDWSRRSQNPPCHSGAAKEEPGIQNRRCERIERNAIRLFRTLGGSGFRAPLRGPGMTWRVRDLERPNEHEPRMRSWVGEIGEAAGSTDIHRAACGITRWRGRLCKNPSSPRAP